jgi:hypothetical protein
MFQKIKTDRPSARTPFLRGFGKLALTLFIGLALLLGAAGSAGAFSVDVKNLIYSDPDREINYNFSSIGDADQLPPNTIRIPDNFVSRKHEVDLFFMFGHLNGLGTASVAHNLDRQVAVIEAADGGVVLHGASSSLQPPEPSSSWTYDVTLKNFVGITLTGQDYIFIVGTTAPMNPGPQPRFRGVWNSAGRLELTPQIYDAGSGTVSWTGTQAVFEGLTPANTTIQLRIENNVGTSGKVSFNYRRDNTGLLNLAGEYTIPGGASFQSLPARFPLVYLKEGAGGGASGGANRELIATGHPPVGFTFATNQIADMVGDFLITGYQGGPPYSAYGWLGTNVSIQNLGFKTLDPVPEIPTTGYETPDSILLTEGNTYAFRLADGAYGLLYVRSVTPTPPLGVYAVTMIFDYLYQGGSTPPPPETVSFSGWVRNTGNTGFIDAQVQAWAVTGTPPGTQISSANAGGIDGVFTITGIPVGQMFYLHIPTPSGTDYKPVLSRHMILSQNTQALLPFVLFTAGEYSDIGNNPEKGLILGRVAMGSNPDQRLAGATITVRQWTPSGLVGDPLPVTYTGGGAATAEDGMYMVKDVTVGEYTLYQVTASLPGYTFNFNDAVVPARAGVVTEESFFATAGGSCTYALNHEVATWAKDGGSHTVQVTAGTGCAWTALSNNTGWLSVASGASGTGNGTVNYTVAANTAAARIGTITIAGRTFAVVQGGVETITSPIVGTWGAASLQYENQPKVWYAEAAKATFYADGKGLLEGVKNDGINQPGQRIKQFTEPFTYTVAPNADGSINLTINMGQGAFQNRIVVSDSGNMAIQDGTGDPAWEKLQVMLKIDTGKTYSNADLNGDYYFLGFERNVAGAADPPSGNGSYMAISGIHTFNGAGTYSYSGKANSVKLDGGNHIWDDSGKAGQAYAVSADGGMTAGSGAFQGAIAGNGKIFGGSGSYSSDNWMAYLFMKKADKTYATADLAGKWAVVGFGQESEAGKPMLFMSEIGTFTCNTTGVCAFKFKQRRSDGTIAFDTGNVNLTVSADGSFGASLPGGVAFAGAIGNDGNTFMVNSSFNASEPWQRQILVGVRANSIGDLAGDPPQPNNLLINGGFDGNLNGWVVNPAVQTGTPPWSPLLGDGSGVNLHPDIYGFMGTILHQNLNLTGVGGKSFTVSVRLTKVGTPLAGKTVAVWLSYVDAAGALQRVKVLNPDNGSIATNTLVTGTFVAPAGAQKIVKLELAKENYGEFHADDVVLWAEGVTTNPTPQITGLSAAGGAYGTQLTINGANFGATQGSVAIGGVPAQIVSWSDTAIVVNVAAPIPGGRVVVTAGRVESNPSQPFQVTSPYFTVDLLDKTKKVIKGQKAEYLLKSLFYNGFTTTGIALQLQGGDTSALTGKAVFLPVPIKGAGGALLKIDTAALNAGTYTANIQAVNGEQVFPVGTFTLQVVTVNEIKFYDWDYSQTPTAKTYFPSTRTLTKQDQFFTHVEVVGSDSQIFEGDAGVVLQEAGQAGLKLGVYKVAFGYEFYALWNGSTTLRATAPDGTVQDLGITVNYPTDSYISAIGLSAPDGAPSIYPIYNDRTAPINWFAQGTTTLGWIGQSTAFMWNFETSFTDNVNRSQDYLSATSQFNLLNLPAGIGTAILHASTNDGKAKAAIPLTTVNAAGTGLLAFGIRSLDPMAFAEMFRVYFFNTDGQLQFSRNVFAMHHEGRPILVGNIPPGTYKILVVPGNAGVKPQWWPNAADIAGAAPVAFAADQTVGDFYFFVQPQPAGASVTISPVALNLATPAAAIGSFNVTAAADVAWAPFSGEAWITVTSGFTGAGNGTVGFAVAANTGPNQRQGTITIGDKAFTVTQPGTSTVLKGDINGDGKVDLADAVLALKVMAGLGQTGVRANYATSGADVNGDGMVGAAEVGYILQYAAGLRQ